MIQSVRPTNTELEVRWARVESYEELTDRIELYRKLQEGIADIKAGNTRPFGDVMADLRKRRELRWNISFT